HVDCRSDVSSYDLAFFFQAEDGIRARNVTGVQTCALPIWTAIDNQIALRRPGPRITCHGRRCAIWLSIAVRSAIMPPRSALRLEIGRATRRAYPLTFDAPRLPCNHATNGAAASRVGQRWSA